MADRHPVAAQEKFLTRDDVNRVAVAEAEDIDTGTAWGEITGALTDQIDLYVEGAFTPGITFGGGSTGMTFALQQGCYTKIGRLVEFEATVILSAKGSSTGAASITGLPFASAAGVSASPNIGLSNVAGFTVPVARVVQSLATVSIFNFNGSTSAAATDANFLNNSVIFISGTYTAA